MKHDDIREARARADHYRAQAAHCYVKASAAKDQEKHELLRKAEEWRALAEATEALIQEMRSQPSYTASAS